jgi:Domain of unknown function (DUF1995)
MMLSVDRLTSSPHDDRPVVTPEAFLSQQKTWEVHLPFYHRSPMMTPRVPLRPARFGVAVAALVAVVLDRRTTTTHAFLQCRDARIAHPAMLPRHRGLLLQQLRQSSLLEDEAERLLELARKMRQEVAALEGKTIEQVEDEAKQARAQRQEKAENDEAARRKRIRDEAERARVHEEEEDGRVRASRRRSGSMVLSVPETPDEQVAQARGAVERAFADGITRQVVRFALVQEGETLASQDPSWPGGAQQMSREAAAPLTRELLRVLRAPTTTAPSNRTDVASDVDRQGLRKPPVVKSQDVWDFDGSAIITAEASTGASDDIQALVMPNTDTKYTRDIAAIDRAMGSRLFLLVNPFWRDIESWGFNLLAPRGKVEARQAIFDRGFAETYHVLQKSVNGEDCIGVKAYPYDWQLYARAESEDWPFEEYTVHLGSTPEEPTSADFVNLLLRRDEFKLSKNMRRMQRIMNRNE